MMTVSGLRTSGIGYRRFVRNRRHQYSFFGSGFDVSNLLVFKNKLALKSFFSDWTNLSGWTNLIEKCQRFHPSVEVVLIASLCGDVDLQDLGSIPRPTYLSEEYAGANPTGKLRLAIMSLNRNRGQP
jgi:hypothetical protein